MNYQKIYNDLVIKSRKEKRKKLKRDNPNYVYYERHHIIPKCLGGDNSKENLVLLTAREHFVAHKLLVEIYPKNGKLINSLWMMSNVKLKDKRVYRVSSKEYERLKIIYSKLVSKRFSGENNPKYGKPMSDDLKEKLRLVNLGKVMSDETKKLLSEKRKGVKKIRRT